MCPTGAVLTTGTETDETGPTLNISAIVFTHV